MSNKTATAMLTAIRDFSCDGLYAEINAALNPVVTNSFASGNSSAHEQRHLAIESAIDNVAAPIICSFGIIGNILNLIVLTRKSLQCSMDHMEKSAHMGLVALAVSDMLYCFVYLFKTFITEKSFYFSQRDWITDVYYHTYREGIINVFVFSSTWLTVIMALGRYVAVCRPLHARGFINLRATRVAIACVFLASVLANIPRFLHYYVHRIPCEAWFPDLNVTRTPDGVQCPCSFYMKDQGELYQDRTFVFYYNMSWSIVVVFHPLLILVVCNVCLIRALRQSYKIQKLYRANKPKDSSHAITPTLIALIVLFVILVGPSGMLVFFRDNVIQPSASVTDYNAFMLAVKVANCLVLLNFAVNFVLYCIINAQFRKIVADLVCCAWLRHQRSSRLGSVYSRSSHTTAMFNISELETEF